MADRDVPEELAALDKELAGVTRQVEYRIDPTPRAALVVAVAMLALLGGLLLPWTGSALGWQVLAGLAPIGPLPRLFTFTSLGFGLVVSALALGTRWWGLAWLAALGLRVLGGARGVGDLVPADRGAHRRHRAGDRDDPDRAGHAGPGRLLGADRAAPLIGLGVGGDRRFGAEAAGFWPLLRPNWRSWLGSSPERPREPGLSGHPAPMGVEHGLLQTARPTGRAGHRRIRRADTGCRNGRLRRLGRDRRLGHGSRHGCCWPVGIRGATEARVRAAALWAGDRACVSGPAAAWWHGMLADAPSR